MALGLTYVDPWQTPFFDWSAELVQGLAKYNVPNPVNEDSWATWASEVVAIPALAELGAPNPATFSTWRDWAAAFSQVLW